MYTKPAILQRNSECELESGRGTRKQNKIIFDILTLAHLRVSVNPFLINKSCTAVCLYNVKRETPIIIIKDKKMPMIVGIEPSYWRVIFLVGFWILPMEDPCTHHTMILNILWYNVVFCFWLMFCAYYDVLCGVSVILNSQFLNWAKLGCIVLFFESNACMNYCIIDWNENVSLGSEATMKQAHFLFVLCILSMNMKWMSAGCI